MSIDDRLAVNGWLRVHKRDRQAVELGVGRLGHDFVNDLVLGVGSDPVGDHLAEELAVPRLCRGEHLDAQLHERDRIGPGTQRPTSCGPSQT